MPKPNHCLVCERKTFDDLCTGLIQPCQCQAINAWKMIKTVQVCLANSNELTEHSLDVNACTCISERTCPSC